jgi:hypothetical protein
MVLPIHNLFTYFILMNRALLPYLHLPFHWSHLPFLGRVYLNLFLDCIYLIVVTSTFVGLLT